jgi:hypothetical protein
MKTTKTILAVRVHAHVELPKNLREATTIMQAFVKASETGDYCEVLPMLRIETMETLQVRRKFEVDEPKPEPVDVPLVPLSPTVPPPTVKPALPADEPAPEDEPEPDFDPNTGEWEPDEEVLAAPPPRQRRRAAAE